MRRKNEKQAYGIIVVCIGIIFYLILKGNPLLEAEISEKQYKKVEICKLHSSRIKELVIESKVDNKINLIEYRSILEKCESFLEKEVEFRKSMAIEIYEKKKNLIPGSLTKLCRQNIGTAMWVNDAKLSEEAKKDIDYRRMLDKCLSIYKENK